MLTRACVSLTVALAVSACAAAQAPAASAAPASCRVAAARVPALFADLDWVKEAARDQHLFSGPASGTGAGGAYDDPDAAGTPFLTLREVDLDADGDCDLVGTVTSGSGAAGGGRSHLVYWFAETKGWRRQGPTPGPGAKGLNAVALELFEPAGAAEMAVFGAEGYATSPLEGGRVALALRSQEPGVKSAVVRVLAFDAKSRTMQPLAAAAAIASNVASLCAKDSEAEACVTW